MVTNELTKIIKLFTPQFDEVLNALNLNIHRISMDMDGIMFRAKYMLDNNLDLDKIDDLKNQYVESYIRFNDLFTMAVIHIICMKSSTDVATVPQMFEDILISNIDMGPEYVSFKAQLYSKDKSLLQRIDEYFKNDEVTNLYPNKYFRFKVDSYNDGIAKAYPELFENKSQSVIGTGNDADVFCHTVTLQVGERCSLNCTYCFEAGTLIKMDNGTVKPIEDIKIGDYVMGFDEKLNRVGDKLSAIFSPAKVTNVMTHQERTVTIRHPYITDTHVTLDHPMLIHNGKFVKVRDLRLNTHGLMHFNHHTALPMYVYDIDYSDARKKTVYNLTTETGTYIANGLLVHNCYQFNKSEMRMDFDTAKTFIDNLLEDKYSYVNQYNSPAIILEFIGGEPLMEIDLITKVYEYFLKRCYELNHPYFTMHRLSICSNGMQYFDKAVQSFFKKYSSRVSFNISIDGNKELHDSCRVQPNGEGSYDVDIAALNHYNSHYSKERNSKMTLAPANIKYLFESVKDFIASGTSVINLNCVFEEGWKIKHAHEEYNQLKQLADYIIDNNLEHIYISIFRDNPDSSLPKEQDSTSCGGAGAMLAVRPNGDIYPCIRYMPSSVGNNVEDLKMGNVHDGMIGREENSNVLKMLDSITRRSSTNDICYNCPIASSCMSCIALGHTVYGTPGKRTTFTCDMVKAEHLANVYFWNKLLSVHPEYNFKVREIKISKKNVLQIITPDEYDELTLVIAAAMIAKMN